MVKTMLTLEEAVPEDSGKEGRDWLVMSAMGTRGICYPGSGFNQT